MTQPTYDLKSMPPEDLKGELKDGDNIEDTPTLKHLEDLKGELKVN